MHDAGSKCVIGARSKLNGCVLMDGVSIGDGCGLYIACIYAYVCLPCILSYCYALIYNSLRRADMSRTHSKRFNEAYDMLYYTLLFIIHTRCTIQNSIICSNVVIEGTCSINDCQISEGVTVLANSKVKGEVLTL